MFSFTARIRFGKGVCVGILLLNLEVNFLLAYSKGKYLLREHLAENVNKPSWTDSVTDRSATKRSDQSDAVTVLPLHPFNHFPLWNVARATLTQ